METSSRIQSIYDESSSDDEFDVVAAAGSCPTQNKSFWVLAKQLLASHNPSPVLARRWARSRTQLEKMTAIVSMLYEKRLRNFAISNQSYSDFVQLCTYEWGKLVRSLRKLTLDDRQIYQILGEKGFDVKYGAIENRLLKRFTRLEHWCGIHFSDMRIDDQLSRLEEKLSGKWKDDHFFSHLNPPLVAIFGLDHLIIQTFGRMKETMAFFPSENQGNTMYAFYVRDSPTGPWKPDNEFSDLATQCIQKLFCGCERELRFMLSEHNLDQFPRRDNPDHYFSRFFASKYQNDIRRTVEHERQKGASIQIVNLFHALFVLSDEYLTREYLKERAIPLINREWMVRDVAEKRASIEPYCFTEDEEKMKPEERERKHRSKIFRNVFGIPTIQKEELFNKFYGRWVAKGLP